MLVVMCSSIIGVDLCCRQMHIWVPVGLRRGLALMRFSMMAANQYDPANGEIPLAGFWRVQYFPHPVRSPCGLQRPIPQVDVVREGYASNVVKKQVQGVKRVSQLRLA
jgi:hypothetical protein